MTSDTAVPSLRERTRRAVQTELTAAAERLFVAHGYDATTIDQIASEAGLSRRSFFRYFSSKEELVIGKYELFRETLTDALDAASEHDDTWTALRRAFDVIVTYNAGTAAIAEQLEMTRVVDSTPTLHAAYLAVFDRMQAALADRLAARPGSDRLEASALVGSAFACLRAAQQAFTEDVGAVDFSVRLDAAMNAVRPLATTGSA